MQAVPQAQPRQQSDGAGRTCRAGPERAGQRDVGQHVQVVDQPAGLGQHTDVTAAQPGLLRRGPVRQPLPGDVNAAAAGVVETGQQPQQGGLARARGTHHGDHLARVQDEVDVAQGRHLAVDPAAAPVEAVQPTGLEHRGVVADSARHSSRRLSLIVR